MSEQPQPGIYDVHVVLRVHGHSHFDAEDKARHLFEQRVQNDPPRWFLSMQLDGADGLLFPGPVDSPG